MALLGHYKQEQTLTSALNSVAPSIQPPRADPNALYCTAIGSFTAFIFHHSESLDIVRLALRIPGSWVHYIRVPSLKRHVFNLHLKYRYFRFGINRCIGPSIYTFLHSMSQPGAMPLFNTLELPHL